MEEKSKINTVDKVIMLILAASADIGEILAALGVALPGIGPALPVIAWFYGFTISVILVFWLIMKGVSVRWFLSGSLIDLIPLLNILPIRTAAILATFLEDSLPGPLKTVFKAATGKAK